MCDKNFSFLKERTKREEAKSVHGHGHMEQQWVFFSQSLISILCMCVSACVCACNTAHTHQKFHKNMFGNVMGPTTR